MAERLRRLLPGPWFGLLVSLVLATGTGFALLPPAEAGRFAARLLGLEAHASLAFAVLLFLLERRHARDAAEAGRGSLVSAGMLLVLGTLFCTVAGYFAVLPMMEAARAGHGTLSFAALHTISSGFYAVKVLVVLALAWRATAASSPAAPATPARAA